MKTPHFRRHEGFTLIELLVVTGMLAGFMALVVVGFRSTGGSQVRQCAQLVGGAFLSTQSKALANDVGSALILVPGVNGMPASACNTIYRSDVPPPATGTCTGIPPSSLSATSATPVLTLLTAGNSALADGYKIRFYSDISSGSPPSLWMQFASPNTVSFRSDINQTVNNTIWPLPVAGRSGEMDFEIARRPGKTTVDFKPPEKAGIDLRYSGVGDSVTNLFGVAGTEITVSFNRQGSLDTVIQGSGAVITPMSPVYFLIASLEEIENDLSLSSETARWLVINPSTGRVNVSPNVAVGGVAFANVTATHLQTARTLARQGSAGGVE